MPPERRWLAERIVATSNSIGDHNRLHLLLWSLNGLQE
jgi:hypothetical protein